MLGKHSRWRCMCLCVSQFTCATDQKANKQQQATVRNNGHLSVVAYFVRANTKT